MARHTAHKLVSPEVTLTPEQLCVEASRTLKRIRKKVPRLTAEEILAELAPTASRLDRLVEVLEAKESNRLRLRQPVEAEDPEEASPPQGEAEEAVAE